MGKGEVYASPLFVVNAKASDLVRCKMLSTMAKYFEIG